MKKWKKPLSVLLALVMACSAMSAAFMASAKDEFQYPEGVTEEKVTNTITFLDDMVLGLIKPETGVYTNYTVGMLAKAVIDLLNPIFAGMGGGIFPYNMWDFTSDMPNNPLEAYMTNTTSWDGIDLTQLDYGFEDGDEAGFYTALGYMLRPIKYILSAFSDEAQMGGDLIPPEDSGIPLPVPIYRYAIYPIFAELGLSSIVTPDDYTASKSMMAVAVSLYGGNLETGDLDNFYETSEQKDEIAAAMVVAKENGDTETFAAKKQELLPIVQKYNSLYDISCAPIIDPILDLVKQLLHAPLSTLLDLLPKLDTLASSGAIDFVYSLLFPDVTETPTNLVDLLNLVLGTLPIINNQPLGLELSAFDAAALKDNSPEERFIIVLRYLIDNIKTEKNLKAITALVGDNPDVANILALVPNLETDALIGMVVALANPEPDEPTTEPDEPTTEPDEPTTATPDEPTTEKPNDSTTTTEPDTQDTPDTGDAAIGALAAVSLAAAAAFVLTAKKKAH